MIRNIVLLDKLIADLHFHKYLYVNESDNIFYYHNEEIDTISEQLKLLGLDRELDPHVDFFHGGSVSNSSQIEQIYRYVDDVYIDFFFRSHSFEEIIFPKGFCYEKITPNGIIHPQTDISINLNNIYDRCTFAHNMWRLFGIDKTLLDVFPNNQFINGSYINNRTFGLHAHCGVLVNEKPFHIIFDEYIMKRYNGKGKLDPIQRGKEIYSFIDFIYHESELEIYNCHSSVQLALHNFSSGFSKISDSNFFGNYTIEDLLFIYSLLTDKFLLTEDAFLLALCFCFDYRRKNRIIDEFIDFENDIFDYREIEPFIISNDLCLRFASHNKSKAFTFKHINDVIDNVLLFERNPIPLIKHSNTMPLPYLYKTL